MHVFEYPYIIITIFILCFAAIVAVGIQFAIKGVKIAKGQTKLDFSTIGKLGSAFDKIGKLREDRCVVHISVVSDDYQNPYSNPEVFSEINQILLNTFSDEGNGNIALYGEKNLLAIVKWNIETARTRVEECLVELNKCFLKHSALNIVDVKFGLFFAFGTEVSFDEAVERSKQACLLAKKQQVPYAEWNVTDSKALEKKIKIENSIEKEIDNNRFFLEYQPVLDAKTKTIIGAEVLSRLNSENEGILTPGSFLSAVDSVGINEKFDYYIFEKNCKWISNDKEQRQGYKYTINFSRTTLCEPEFAKKIIDIAEKYDLKYSCLAVEVLEDKNVTGDAKNQMIENLAILKEKGVSILLDDFGSGYTTFGDLQNLDISIVKIDKTITQKATTETGYIILENIIRTSKGIGFKTLCEGIETKEQEEAAIRAGSDFLQGFYYYRPMPVYNLEKLLKEGTGGV